MEAPLPGAVAVDNGTATLDFRPFEVKTLMLEDVTWRH
jgi:hypothetical protein